MRRTLLQTLLTLFLLIAFVADATNVIRLYAPQRIVSHEVNVHVEITDDSSPDECITPPPPKHFIKFTDIDSPLLQVACRSDGFCETLTYTISNDCYSFDIPPLLISLHKLCILLL